MTLDEAIQLNGLYCCFQIDLGDGDGLCVRRGRVVGVCVPCLGSPVSAHLLVAQGGHVSPCGCGTELFLEDITKVLRKSSTPYLVEPPALSVVRAAGNLLAV